MLAIHVTGLPGVAAVLGVAAVVCVACSVSGSLIQDLKAGHLLGGTPWKMEVVEIIAVILLAFFLMGPLIAENKLAFEEKGTLLASGLIAGEAIVGILLAVVFLTGIPALATFSFYPA